MNTLQSGHQNIRASKAQLSAMLDFFEQNKDLATGNRINGREMYDQMWEELARSLNNVSGAQKSVPQWQKTWTDVKSRAVKKMRNNEIGRAATGNGATEEMELTPFDVRVIKIIHPNYVEGSADYADSFPLEIDLQEQLATGNDSASSLPPQTVSVRRFDDNTSGNPTSSNNAVENSIDCENPTEDEKDFTSTEESGFKKELERRTPKSNKRNLPARGGFVSMSNKCADTMKVMANALQKQAEAIIVITKAAGTKKSGD